MTDSEERANAYWRVVAGWSAVGISTLMAGFWAFWGIIENFHEGWWQRSLLDNVAMMLSQYLGAALVFMTLGVIAIRWGVVGGLLHVAAGVALYVLLFHGDNVTALMLIMIPMAVLGAGYAIGEIPNRMWAYRLVVLVPLGVMLFFGVEPAWRVSQRQFDNDPGARVLPVGKTGEWLMWAPAGPGWPEEGCTWFEARERCARLSLDGCTLADSVVGVWRLPTVGELVRSARQHGQLAGGTYDSLSGRVMYVYGPDKESPLWNPYSKVIYWWTASEIDDSTVYKYVYDGKIWPARKRSQLPYLGYRAVREVDSAVNAATADAVAETSGH
jgi:hypothetical protein